GGGSGSAAARVFAPAPRGGGAARREYVLPRLPAREGESAHGADGPLRGCGRRVRAVRFRPGGCASAGWVDASRPLRGLSTEVLPLGVGGARARRACRVAGAGTAALLRAWRGCAAACGLR